jgi:hypothetical protein
MTKDHDDRYYFDYVSWKSVVAVAGGADRLYPGYLRKVGGLIETGLKHHNTGVVEKYLWLYGQYIKAISLVEQLPADHGYRTENPDHCIAIENQGCNQSHIRVMTGNHGDRRPADAAWTNYGDEPSLSNPITNLGHRRLAIDQHERSRREPASEIAAITPAVLAIFKSDDYGNEGISSRARA